MHNEKKIIKHCQAFVREIIKNGKEDVAGNTSKGPSNEWISFLKRHPKITMQTPDFFDCGR